MLNLSILLKSLNIEIYNSDINKINTIYGTIFLSKENYFFDEKNIKINQNSVEKLYQLLYIILNDKNLYNNKIEFNKNNIYIKSSGYLDGKEIHNVFLLQENILSNYNKLILKDERIIYILNKILNFAYKYKILKMYIVNKSIYIKIKYGKEYYYLYYFLPYNLNII